eukprot:Tbor_TRINITY_DN5528_c2_g4::TRINITY_DN5528_c2_g4_i1::g.13110::m.13110
MIVELFYAIQGLLLPYHLLSILIIAYEKRSLDHSKNCVIGMMLALLPMYSLAISMVVLWSAVIFFCTTFALFFEQPNMPRCIAASVLYVVVPSALFELFRNLLF